MSWVFGPGGSATTPGGADQDIQFNNNGSFSGSNLLTTDGSGSLSASTHVSASTFYGDGSNLTGVTASAVEVADGPQYSLQFRFDSPVSGDLSGSANFVVSSDMSTFFITGSTILSGALSSSDIVPLADEQYDIGQEGLGYENAYINFLNGGVAFTVQNDEGATISKGDVVYIKGISGGNPTVGLAACDEAAKMPAFGFVADGSITQGSTGRVVTLGRLNGINTAAFSEGDILYVQTGSGGTSGSVTNVRPTGSNNLLQNIGKVTEAAASGQIRVGGAGRTNATPNLDKGHIFVGDESDCSIQDSTIFVSASAERVGINKTVPTAALHVSASSVHGGESARFEGEVVITSPEGKLQVQDTTNNYQVTLVPAAIPRVAFGTTSNETQYMVIDGGNTNRFITVNDFFIGTSSVYSQGLYYDVSEERIGINTSAPTHDLTVDGDLSVTDAYVSSIPADRVLVSTTNGQITSHSPFTFASDVLSVPTITASVGISSSILILDPTSGSLAGDGSYLGLNANNQIIVTSSAGGGGTPGGADTQVQFNDGGSFGGDSTFTFNKTTNVLSVPTITASVGIQTEALEVTSSANGSINIGEGISYVQSGVDRFEIFENEFKFENVKFYQGVSTENTSNFNIGDKQVFLVDTNSSVVTGTLPGVTSTDDVGITYTIKDSGGNAGTNDIVIEPSGSQTIDGGSAAKIQTNYGAMTVVSFSSSVNGFGWGVVSVT